MHNRTDFDGCTKTLENQDLWAVQVFFSCHYAIISSNNYSGCARTLEIQGLYRAVQVFYYSHYAIVIKKITLLNYFALTKRH